MQVATKCVQSICHTVVLQHVCVPPSNQTTSFRLFQPPGGSPNNYTVSLGGWPQGSYLDFSYSPFLRRSVVTWGTRDLSVCGNRWSVIGIYFSPCSTLLRELYLCLHRSIELVSYIFIPYIQTSICLSTYLPASTYLDLLFFFFFFFSRVRITSDECDNLAKPRFPGLQPDDLIKTTWAVTCLVRQWLYSTQHNILLCISI